MKPPPRLRLSDRAWRRRGGERSFSLPNHVAGDWGGGSKWDLIALWSLVVLKDLGLDPASKEARRMIDRVDKGLGLSRLTTGLIFTARRSLASTAGFLESVLISRSRTTHWQSNSWVSSSRMVAGTAKHPKVGALRFIRLSACLKDCSSTSERGANRRLLRRLARGLKTICSSAACFGRFELAKLSTNAGCAFRFRCFGTMTFCAGWIICEMQVVRPDSRVGDAIEVVIARRHQNGRWPMNLLHPEEIPLKMETGVGRASRWNTLRALRVLRWYNDSTGVAGADVGRG